MLSLKAGIFYSQEHTVFIRHPVDNKVSALARLTFYEKLLIRQEKFSVVDIDGPSVLSGLNLEKR